MVLLIIGLIIICVGGYLLYTQSTGEARSNEEQIHGTQTKITDKDGKGAARKEGNAATARAGARESLNNEAQQIVNSILIETAAVQADFDLKEAPYRLEELRISERLASDLVQSFTREALEEGISVEALVEVKRKYLMDEAERTHQAKLGQQAIVLGLIVQNLREHQAIAELQKTLDNLYLERADIEQKVNSGLIPASAGAEMIADRNNTIRMVKKDKDGREQRLLQAYNGKKSQRNNKDSNLR